MDREIAEMAGQTAAAPSPRRILLACSATHLVSDGLIAAFYPLLPLIALDLQLNYTAVGSIRTALVASSSLFQIPVGYLAEWIPETALLGAGMLWMSFGFAALAIAAAFWPLISLTAAAGLGGNAQHPIGTAIVSELYDSSGRGKAVSTLNFAGDLGKVIFPSVAGLVGVAFGWRAAVVVLGLMGIAASIGYALALGQQKRVSRRPTTQGPKVRGWGIEKPRSYALLSAIGVIDNGIRVGSITFLPFLMAEKGLDTAQVSFLLTLLFAAGAAGKLGCGFLADRFGNVGVIVITEAVTALALLAAIPVGPVMLVPVVVAIGFVGNGTSSALYSAVADMVHVEKRARGYGLFYTLSLGVGTISPLLCGLLADSVGVSGSFAAMAAVVLVTLPLALLMRRD